MNYPRFRLAYFKLLFAVIAILLLVPSAGQTQLKPSPQDKLIAELVCAILQKHHLSKPEINDELSKRLMRRYIKSFDQAKLYFTKSDVDEFKKQETELDDLLLKGNVDFAFQVHAKYLARFEERMKLIEEFVAAKHDFTVDESLDTDYDKLEYASTAEEIRERWRKRIKFDLLLQRIAEKPLPEAEAKQKVLDRYKGQLKRAKQLDNGDIVELYLNVFTTCIDPHTNYMSPATLDDFEIAMRLNLDGIGAILRTENGYTSIVEIVPGGPADKDGRLKPEDKIVGVAQGNGEFVDAVDMKGREVVKMIRGPRGTKVQLKVLPVGKIEPVVYELTRQKIEMKSQEARGEVVEQGKKADGAPYKVGVIDLPSFYADFSGTDRKSCAEDVRKILQSFETKNVDAVVLDLRRNGGGSLGECLTLTGLFIDEGPVVLVKGPQGKATLKDPEKGVVYGGPLVVLVSRYSASASEILAGAMQDYGRALIVGDKATHGKGTVQKMVDLGGTSQSKLGAIKLTIQQFYRVNGDSTQSMGVLSDIVLPSISDITAPNEKDSEFALEFDKVAAADHASLDLTPDSLKTKLRDLSAKRVSDSKDFEKLAKDIELLKARKARKSMPLNEKELKALFSKEEAEKVDQKNDDPDEKPEAGAYKFKRNFTNNEILQITEDFVVLGKKK